ncbi:hypothetical protein Dimus_024166 [Dionaea muscipula]
MVDFVGGDGDGGVGHVFGGNQCDVTEKRRKTGVILYWIIIGRRRTEAEEINDGLEFFVFSLIGLEFFVFSVQLHIALFASAGVVRSAEHSTGRARSQPGGHSPIRSDLTYKNAFQYQSVNSNRNVRLLLSRSSNFILSSPGEKWLNRYDSSDPDLTEFIPAGSDSHMVGQVSTGAVSGDKAPSEICLRWQLLKM